MVRGNHRSLEQGQEQEQETHRNLEQELGPVSRKSLGQEPEPEQESHRKLVQVLVVLLQGNCKS